jgi:hypothetical protein
LIFYAHSFICFLFFSPTLFQIDSDEHAQLVAKMARYIVLKGSATEVLLQAKLNEEVLGEKYKAMRGLSKQVLAEAAAHVHAVFGYKLVKAPKRHFPQAKFKDGFYLVNDLPLGQKENTERALAHTRTQAPLEATLAFFD